MTRPAVEVQDVSFAYRAPRAQPTSLKEYAVRRARREVALGRRPALDGIDLAVAAGEVLGIIGANGSGKSTLMRLLARIYLPARGRIVVRGRCAPMISLGAGMQPELSGRDNVELYGALLGLRARDMRRRADDIGEWAELRDVLDDPIRTYSTGMLARLAFAIATDGHPDVLLVDEILAVGDARFALRAVARIEERMAGGAAVLLVSHSMDLIRQRSHRVLWLDRGQTAALGDPAAVTREYEAQAG